ncbi:MAG: glucose-6-phosphate isomerase [Synergistaceae bacterium]|jgi:glucose-6-phosphate isomerase|nr:glucose-6-phosphate isomerase [Synergistaceae bacterium]
MSEKPGKLGISFSFGAAGGEGGTSKLESSIGELGPSIAEAVEWVKKNASRDESGFGWYNLPDKDPSDVLKAAEWLRGYDSIIHVGIGGSALGNLMLHQALLPFYFNERPAGGAPRFYLADNPDPEKARAIWQRVKGSRAALVGVSKSGATAETMSQFLWFRSKMAAESGGSVDGDALVITDPKGGVFRSFANDTKCRSLEIPPSVGGRYSVLTPCGLVTASALGADIKALLKGAADMRDFLASAAGVEANPALFLAATHLFHERGGRPMTVLMPYANRLETFAEWFAQLWGESVGKEGLGTTPVRALGAIDQHSQVQLYTAGPDDKLYTLINVRNRAEEIELSTVSDSSLESLSYLSGRKLGVMLGFEAQSTAAALVKAGRPVVWIELDKIDAHTVGALVFFYEYVTAITGRLLGINPFDQPGVEQGKRYTYGLMGRDGFGKDAGEAGQYFERIKKLGVTA